MPLVFAENEASESGISYDDRTGISYQYPARYRRLIQIGERFVYYRGRRSKNGQRIPQVYFGSGVIGKTAVDGSGEERFVCEVLDYQPFVKPIAFKDANGRYLESGADRRGYFQPGVRTISEDDFRRIIEAAHVTSAQADQVGTLLRDSGVDAGPAYASPAKLKLIEDFSVRVAVEEIQRKFPKAAIAVQPRNNPGFDVLVRVTDAEFYFEVKGTTRSTPQFFMTEGEVQFSRRNAAGYRLMVVYNIQLDVGTYSVRWYEGPVTEAGGFLLEPIQWSVKPTG